MQGDLHRHIQGGGLALGMSKMHPLSTKTWLAFLHPSPSKEHARPFLQRPSFPPGRDAPGMPPGSVKPTNLPSSYPCSS